MTIFEYIVCNAGGPQFNSWVGKIPSRRAWQPTPVFMGFPGGSDGKESACNAGDLGLIPGLGRSPGEGKGYPLQLFWPGEFAGLYSPWGRKELDTTERLSTVYVCVMVVLLVCCFFFLLLYCLLSFFILFSLCWAKHSITSCFVGLVK